MRRILTAVLVLTLAVIPAAPAFAAAAGDPLPPVENARAQMSAAALDASADPEAARKAAGVSDEPTGKPSGEASGEASSEEPSGEAVLPLVPGKYKSGDGSVLTVQEDGVSTYETLVSGTINGRDMSGRLTFHGTFEDSAFSFDRVTFLGLDLTDIAASLGFTDASYWEEEAGALYAEAIADTEIN